MDTYSDVRRVQSTSRTELDNTLKTKMLGVSNDTNPSLGYKKSSGDMLWFNAEGTDATYNSVTLEGLADGFQHNIGIDESGTIIIYGSGNQSNIEDCESQMTGVTTGGGISYNTSATINITAGTGKIIDSFTDPITPAHIDVTWANTTYTPSLIPSGEAFYTLALDSTGTPITIIGTGNESDRRNYLTLGFFQSSNGAITSGGVISAPYRNNNIGNLALSYMYFNDLNDEIKGLSMNATSATNLQLWGTAGSQFLPFSNMANSNEPSVYPIPQAGSLSAGANLFWFTRDGVQRGTGNTAPKFYDNNGVYTALPVNKTVIHYVFQDPKGKIYIQLGQTIYNSYSEATGNLYVDSDTYVFYPFFRQGYDLVAQLVLSQNSTSWDKTTANIFNYKFQTAPGGGTVVPNLQRVLQAGNSAAGQSIIDLSYIANSTGNNLISMGSGGTTINSDGVVNINAGTTGSVASINDLELKSSLGTVNIKRGSTPYVTISNTSQLLPNTSIADITNSSTGKQIVTREYVTSVTSGATQNLKSVLTVGNNGGGLGITSAGDIDSGNLAMVRSGKWQVSAPATTGNTPTMYGFVVNTTANGAYTQVGTRDAGSGYGTFPYYRRGATQWYLIRQGWYWLVTHNLSNPEWATSIAYGAGGQDLPDGYYIKYNTETGTNIYCTFTAGTSIVDSLVVEGSMFCDQVVKSNNGFNVNGNLAITQDLIQYKDLSSLQFNDDGSVSLPKCTIGDISDNDDIVTKQFGDSYYNQKKYASIGEQTASSFDISFANWGEITTLTSSSSTITINFLGSPIESYPWFDFYIPSGIKNILVKKAGVNNTSFGNVTGWFRLYADSNGNFKITKTNQSINSVLSDGNVANNKTFQLSGSNYTYGNTFVITNEDTPTQTASYTNLGVDANNVPRLQMIRYSTSGYNTILNSADIIPTINRVLAYRDGGQGHTFTDPYEIVDKYYVDNQSTVKNMKVNVGGLQTDVAFDLTSSTGTLNFSTGTPLSAGYVTRLSLAPYTANGIWIPTLIGSTANINSAIASAGASALITKGYADATYTGGGSSALTYQFAIAGSGQYIGTTKKYIPTACATDLNWTDLTTNDKFRSTIMESGTLTKVSYAIRETTHDGTLAQGVTIGVIKNGTEIATFGISQNASTKGVYTFVSPSSFSAGDELSFSIVSNATGITIDCVTLIAKVV